MTVPSRLAPLLAQFDFALDRLTTRLDGLSDDEYLWEPEPGGWSVRRDAEVRTSRSGGAGGWKLEIEIPGPDPAPVTTLAWRLTHLAMWLTIRSDWTTGSRSLSWDDYVVPGCAADAIVALADAGAAWRSTLLAMDDNDLDTVGRSQNPWGLDPQLPFLDIAWWVNQELLHHGAEIALLRDLYRAGVR